MVLAKTGYVRIVLEGTTADFESEVSEWLQDGESEGAGNLVILRVPKSDLGKIKERLKVGGPKSLYRAILPPAGDRKLPEIIPGTIFPSENKELAKSEGRHIPLSALPSELAESQAKTKRRCCS